MWKQLEFNVGRDEKDQHEELQFGSFKHLTTKYEEAVFSLFHATWKKRCICFARGWCADGLTEKACTQKILFKSRSFCFRISIPSLVEKDTFLSSKASSRFQISSYFVFSSKIDASCEDSQLKAITAQRVSI